MKGKENNSVIINKEENIQDPIDLNMRSITLKIPSMKNVIRRLSSKDSIPSMTALGSQKEMKLDKMIEMSKGLYLNLLENIKSEYNIDDTKVISVSSKSKQFKLIILS